VLRWICAALTLALLAGVGIYAWRGQYARYLLDDYCTAAKLRDLGFVDAMLWHRNHWSGRYAYFAVKALPESIGPQTAPFTPGITILAFCAAAMWAVRRVTKDALLAASTGLAIVFATIDGTPDILAADGPIVWETVTLTYMLPLVLYCFWAVLFVATGSIVRRCILSALLLFVAGGLSETSLAAQGALTAGVLFYTIIRRMPDARKIAACGFLATIASVLVTVTAPGNATRMSELPPQPPLAHAIGEAFRLAYHYLGSNVFVGGSSLVAILGCGLLAGCTRDRRDVPTLLFLALTALGALVASLLPSTWVLGGSPPPRALHVSSFFFVATLLFIGAAAGAARPRTNIVAAMLLVLAVPITLGTAWTVIGTMDAGRAHATEIERISEILRTSRGQDVTIQSPYTVREQLLSPDRKFWTNVCICEFYGVRSLTAVR